MKCPDIPSLTYSAVEDQATVEREIEWTDDEKKALLVPDLSSLQIDLNRWVQKLAISKGRPIGVLAVCGGLSIIESWGKNEGRRLRRFESMGRGGGSGVRFS